MNGKKKVVIAGVVVGGAALAMGGAFTAGGLSDASGDGFIGGQVDVSISGATIRNIDFELTGDSVDQVTVQFDPADNVLGRTLEIVFQDGSNVTVTNGGNYTCTAIHDADGGAPVLPQSECTTGGTEVLSTAVSHVVFAVDN